MNYAINIALSEYNEMIFDINIDFENIYSRKLFQVKIIAYTKNMHNYLNYMNLNNSSLPRVMNDQMILRIANLYVE